MSFLFFSRTLSPKLTTSSYSRILAVKWWQKHHLKLHGLAVKNFLQKYFNYVNLPYIWDKLAYSWIKMTKYNAKFPPDSFRRVLHFAIPFIEWIPPLLSLIQKIAPFLPFNKKREKKMHFYEICLHIKYVILLTLKVPLEIKNMPLRISKVPLSYLQHPALFWAWGKLCCMVYFMCKTM